MTSSDSERSTNHSDTDSNSDRSGQSHHSDDNQRSSRSGQGGDLSTGDDNSERNSQPDSNNDNHSRSGSDENNEDNEDSNSDNHSRSGSEENNEDNNEDNEDNNDNDGSQPDLIPENQAKIIAKYMRADGYPHLKWMAEAEVIKDHGFVLLLSEEERQTAENLVEFKDGKVQYKPELENSIIKFWKNLGNHRVDDETGKKIYERLGYDDEDRFPDDVLEVYEGYHDHKQGSEHPYFVDEMFDPRRLPGDVLDPLMSLDLLYPSCRPTKPLGERAENMVDRCDYVIDMMNKHYIDQPSGVNFIRSEYVETIREYSDLVGKLVCAVKELDQEKKDLREQLTEVVNDFQNFTDTAKEKEELIAKLKAIESRQEQQIKEGTSKYSKLQAAETPAGKKNKRSAL